MLKLFYTGKERRFQCSPRQSSEMSNPYPVRERPAYVKNDQARPAYPIRQVAYPVHETTEASAYGNEQPKSVYGSTDSGPNSALPELQANQQSSYPVQKTLPVKNEYGNNQPDSDRGSQAESGSGLPGWVVPVVACGGGLILILIVILSFVLIRRRMRRRKSSLPPIHGQMYVDYKAGKRAPLPIPRSDDNKSNESKAAIQNSGSLTYDYLEPSPRNTNESIKVRNSQPHEYLDVSGSEGENNDGYLTVDEAGIQTKDSNTGEKSRNSRVFNVV